jgi:hypothetical protein
VLLSVVVPSGEVAEVGVESCLLSYKKRIYPLHEKGQQTKGISYCSLPESALCNKKTNMASSKANFLQRKFPGEIIDQFLFESLYLKYLLIHEFM